MPKGQKIRITLAGEYDVLRYDTLTGNIAPMAAACGSGKTVINTCLYDLDSLLLRCSPAVGCGVAESVPKAAERKQIGVPKRVSYRLDEPNVYLLDKAEVALDEGAFMPETELLRADNLLRQQLGWSTRQSAVAQPWTIQEPKPEHTVRLRFRVFSAAEFSGVKLALEDAEAARIWCNGREIEAETDGWFTDKAIGTVPLGSLSRGENVIEVRLPFGRRTNVEWCYLLGSFGVHVQGEYRELIPAQPLLGFDDVTRQGLAHYGGNITYEIPVTTAGGKLRVTVPHYTGTAVRVEAEKLKGYIAYPPYQLELDALPAGEHILKLTLLGNRQNCFGPLHRANLRDSWTGPNAWRTEDSAWTESYRLAELGILSAPVIEEILP